MDDVIDRRAFLTAAPRRILRRLRTLMSDAVSQAVSDGTGRRRLAVVDVSRCLAWGGGDCRLCYVRCPLRDQAMMISEGRPVVASRCDGCGVCVDVCRSVNDPGAIRLEVVPSGANND